MHRRLARAGEADHVAVAVKVVFVEKDRLVGVVVPSSISASATS